MDKLTKPFRYVTSGKVRLKFNDTIVRYRGKLYWVVTTSELFLYLLESLSQPSSQRIEVHSSSTSLDLGTPELGWVEYDGRMMYFERRSGATYNQGVSRKNIRAFHLPNTGVISMKSFENTGDLLPYFNASETQEPRSVASVLAAGKGVLNHDIAIGPGARKSVYLHRKLIGHIKPQTKQAVFVAETEHRKTTAPVIDELRQGGYSVTFQL